MVLSTTIMSKNYLSFCLLLVQSAVFVPHPCFPEDQIANCTPCTNRYHGNKRCNYVLQEHKKEQRIESPCDRTLQTDDPPVVKWLLMVIPPDLTENALHHKCRQKFQRRARNDPRKNSSILLSLYGRNIKNTVRAPNP